MGKPIVTEAARPIMAKARKKLVLAWNELAEAKGILEALRKLGYEPPALQPALWHANKCLEWLDRTGIVDAKEQEIN